MKKARMTRYLISLKNVSQRSFKRDKFVLIIIQKINLNAIKYFSRIHYFVQTNAEIKKLIENIFVE